MSDIVFMMLFWCLTLFDFVGDISTAQPSHHCYKPKYQRYRMYLKGLYRSSRIFADSKWPPTPSREYISLTVVKGKRCKDEYIGYTLQRNVADLLERRKKISIQQILEAEEGHEVPRLVLMEGAPGIGKSTLAWELCRNWDEFDCLKKYDLVILLRLREEEVQKIKKVRHFFEGASGANKKTLAEEVLEDQGSRVLFILDGFDELPKPLQQKGFLLDLIKAKVLPLSTVLVTSRPSATADLLSSCKPGKRVEVLGFTQESVERYARSIFSDDPPKLAGFMAYISASSNPAINSLMYVPLNAAIIVEIYQDCRSGDLLPHTLTELYTQLCLTILNRYLKVHHPLLRVGNFKDLPRDQPSDLYQQFLDLCKLAFEGIVNDNVIFSSTPHPNHFGFLDSLPALHGGAGGFSYNFLHLTVQEFFAAYHISCLGTNGRDVFRKYGKDPRWNVVWRFVAGLTKFEVYQDYIDTDVFTAPYNRLSYSLFLFQCVFEAQTMEHFYSALDPLRSPAPADLSIADQSMDDFSSVFESSLVVSTAEKKRPENVFFSSSLFSNSGADENPAAVVHLGSATSTSLDAYSLGYCIANFPIAVTWNVTLEGDLHHSFSCGLKTKEPNEGIISGLHVHSCQIDFAELKSNPLQSITQLSICYCELTNTDMIHFSDLIPTFPNLKALSVHHNRLTDGQQDGFYKVLQKLCSSNVTELHIPNTGLGELLGSHHDYSGILKRLMNPVSGKIEVLGIGHFAGFWDSNDDMVAELLSAGPFSFHTLGLFFEDLSPHVDHLKNNSWLHALGLFFNDPLPHVHGLVDIVRNNTSLQLLGFFIYADFVEVSIDAIKLLAGAVHENINLKIVAFFVVGVGDNDQEVFEYMSSNHEELTLIDPRIIWKHNDH